MKKLVCTLVLVLSTFAATAHAQLIKNLEINGGWAYSTGNQGLNGFNVGAGVFFHPRIQIAADYDGLYDTSTIGAFAITTVGQISTHSHLQNFLFGPRIFFPGLIKGKKSDKKLLTFFGEAQFGPSHLSSNVQAPAQNLFVESSDTAFTWLLGGGADYRLSPRWRARGHLDFMRTHFANEGQSRLRLSLGVSYALHDRAGH